MATGAAAELIDIQHSDLCAAGHLLWPCDGHLRSVCDFPPLRGYDDGRVHRGLKRGHRGRVWRIRGSSPAGARNLQCRDRGTQRRRGGHA